MCSSNSTNKNKNEMCISTDAANLTQFGIDKEKSVCFADIIETKLANNLLGNRHIEFINMQEKCKSLEYENNSLEIEIHDMKNNIEIRDMFINKLEKDIKNKDLTIQYLTAKQNKQEKCFKCEIPKCFKSFSSYNYLKHHIKSHTKKGDFKCNLCEQSFSRKSLLSSHYKIHICKKNYTCQWSGCNFKSATEYHLKVHEIGHNNEKTFVCCWSDCNRTFLTKGNAKNHMKTHIASIINANSKI